MLGKLRKNANSNWVKATFAAIVIVFIFWGVGGVVGGDAMIARVNDEVISAKEFDREYRHALRTLQDQNQSALPQDFVRKQVLDQLITKRLLVQEAERLGLMTGDDELRESITAIPAFQVDGRFNRDQYLGTLRANGFKPADFEDAQRLELLMTKVEEIVRSGAQVTEVEVKDRFLYDNQRVNLRFIKVRAADLRESVTVSDEEIERQYNEDRESYREPPRVRVQYLRFTPDRYTADIQPTDDEIQAYYDTHTGQFRQADSQEPQPLDAVRDAVIAAIRQQRGREMAMKHAEAAHDRLLDGESIDAVATAEGVAVESSPPFSRQEGLAALGSSPDVMGEIFATEPGETGELLTTPDGYAVFRVTDRIDSTIPDLAAVRNRVEAAVRQQKATAAAKDRAEALHKRLETQPDLDGAAQSEHLTVDETGPIIRAGGYVAGIGNAPALKAAAFELTSDAPLAPDVYEANGDWVVAVLKERLPADPADFDKQKATLMEQARRRLEMLVMQQFLSHLRAKAQIEMGQGYAAAG